VPCCHDYVIGSRTDAPTFTQTILDHDVIDNVVKSLATLPPHAAVHHPVLEDRYYKLRNGVGAVPQVSRSGGVDTKKNHACGPTR